jgi:hypothetical protein
MRCPCTRELLLAALAVSMAFAPSLRAQEYRAKITGTVTDSSKAIIPNATVQIHNLDTNEITMVKTKSRRCRACWSSPNSRSFCLTGSQLSLISCA